MPTRDAKALIDNLRTWCDGKWGRRSQVARQLGVSPQLVTEWLNGRALPTLETGLQIQTFLSRCKRSQRKHGAR